MLKWIDCSTDTCEIFKLMWQVGQGVATTPVQVALIYHNKDKGELVGKWCCDSRLDGFKYLKAKATYEAQDEVLYQVEQLALEMARQASSMMLGWTNRDGSIK